MANTIPCPNPVCTNSFTQAQVQSAAQLLCPKCGFRMKGKAAAKPPASAPAAKPVAAKPKPAAAVASQQILVATPVPTPAPIAEPIAAAPVEEPASAPSAAPAPAGDESLADGTFFNPATIEDSSTLVRTSRRKKGVGWVRLLIILLALGFAACVVIAAFGVIYIFWGGGVGLLKGKTGEEGVAHFGSVRDGKGGTEKVFKIMLDKREWAVDNDIISRFGAINAFKHTELEFWFAVVIKDHGMNKPRDADMVRLAIEKLEGHFADTLELGGKAEPANIGGVKGEKIYFKGQVKAAYWGGECYMFFNNGIAYWLYVSSPDWGDASQSLVDRLREKSFSVMSDRRGWREQPPPTETFPSLNGKVTISVPKGVWEKYNAKDEDITGELFLLGKYLKEKDNRKNSSLLVFTFDKKDDLKESMKGAREYLDKKAKNENENNKIALAPEVTPGQTESGELETIGDRRGRILDLKLQVLEEAKRYQLLAIVNEPDATYAILCDCTWENRQIWRQEFLELLRGMRFKKAE